MTFIALIVIILSAFFVRFVYSQQFGKLPSGERLARIGKSPNYRDKQFQNQSVTTVMASNSTYYKALKSFLFSRSKRSTPDSVLPSQKIDLKSLNRDSNLVVWFGHSSYFMHLDGKTFLVDPVLCGSASPVSFTTNSFAGSDLYAPEDFPEIDYVIITHDHWDHLDYKTLMRLKSKIRNIVSSLGVGSHLEYWGFEKNIIFELDWFESQKLDSGFVVTATPARHFTGRFLKRNQTLWASFVLQTPTKRIFMGGDGGYDVHFKTIGDKYGPFDLAVLECGQYNEYWRFIHCMPEQTVQAALDLQAKHLFPVHWAKFVLGLHHWDEPIIRVSKEAKLKNVPLITPMIGEAVNLDNDNQRFVEWWK